MTTYIWPEGGGGGITELTGDVTAGPGSGAQAATVEGLQGNPVSNTAPALNEVLTWDGAQWIPAATTMLSLDGTATGGTVAYIGSVYLPAITTLAVAATAYIGGSLVGDTTALSLVPIAGGPAVATWTRTGTLGIQPLAAPVAGIPAGWYDITLQGTAGSGTAFARGLYLA